MSFGLNKSCCNAMSSSSSSSTKVFCDMNKCSPRCCCHSCCQQTLLNDHSYGLLKKACNKIFKDFNRQKCREKYAVFPGTINMGQTDECPEEPCDCGCYSNAFKGCCCNNSRNKEKECETMILDMEKQFGGQAFFGSNGNKTRPKCTLEQNRSKGGQEKKKSTGTQPRRKGHARKNQTNSNANSLNRSKVCQEPIKPQVGSKLYPINRNVHDHESSLTKEFKPSRFEEVRVCDYLRAKLESRDLRRYE